MLSCNQLDHLDWVKQLQTAHSVHDIRSIVSKLLVGTKLIQVCFLFCKTYSCWWCFQVSINSKQENDLMKYPTTGIIGTKYPQSAKMLHIVNWLEKAQELDRWVIVSDLLVFGTLIVLIFYNCTGSIQQWTPQKHESRKAYLCWKKNASKKSVWQAL